MTLMSRHVSHSAVSLLIMAFQNSFASSKGTIIPKQKTNFADCHKIWKCSFITNLAHIVGFKYWLVRANFEKTAVSDTHTELFPTSQSSDTLAFYLLCIGFCDRTQFWLSLSCIWIRPFFPPHLGILELKSQKPFRPVSFVSVFFLSAVKLEPVFLSVHLVISSSVRLCAPVVFHLCE